MTKYINPDLIKYEVKIVSGIHKEIKAYDYNNVLICELECFRGFYSNEEEIQNWLDDNGYGDNEYEFIDITKKEEE